MTNSVSSITNGLITGVIVAFAGAILQHQYWKRRDQVETARRDFEASLKIIDSVTRSFEQRYFAQLSFWRIMKDGTPTAEEIREYRSAIFTWMSEFAANKSSARFYFGRSKMIEFETDVHDHLRRISDTMLRTQRHGYKNLSLLHRIEHDQIGEDFENARRSFFSFLRSLQESVEDGNIGEARRDREQTSSYDSEPSWNLVQRLFGLKKVNSRARL